MMTDYIFSQTMWCILFALEGAFLVWRYHVAVSRPVTIRALRQRLFALRDRAILLVAEGQANEDDPNWQELYWTLNQSAKTASVGAMRNALSFVRKFLRNVKPPSEEEREKFTQMPPPLMELWADYVLTVFSIVWESSFLLRTAVRLAQHFAFLKRSLERHNPKETANYQVWAASANEVKSARSKAATASIAVGSC